ncbi:MAG: Hpt domain-containing protein [Flavobacteriales bacterium]|nr:Hpt domain-containing protein [Flavobacteriales bacterium]HRA16791.1 Hpt domain-containing protein [Flavobacteriales bacterium]
MVRTLSSRARRWSLSLLCVGCALVLPAQSRTSAADSLKAEVAEQRTSLVLADSTGDLPAAFSGRMRLVPLVSKTEAVKLLKQAFAIANDMGRPDLGSVAHRELAQRYDNAGNSASAYTEALLSDSLERLSAARQRDSLNDQHTMTMARLMAVKDSSVQAGAGRERRIAEALLEVQRNADRWMWIALATAGVGLLLVIGLLYRMGSTSRKLRTSIEALRSEIEALKKPVNRLKELPDREDVVCAIPESGLYEAPAIALDEAMDPVVVAMFRKSAPERLATLQQAREQADHAKVVRVVHSLKPQLISFDQERFTPLCARLMTTGAEQNKQLWSADLDALEAAISDLLIKAGH